MPTMCSLYRLQVGLSVEALPKFVVRGELGGQNLEGIAAGQPRVLRQIHVAHAAAPQTPNDGVPGEHLAFVEALGAAVACRHVSMLLRR
jgi:hypothetical protein